MLMVTECDAFYITARKVAEALAQAGHSVKIIALRGKETLANEECGGYQISRVNLVAYKHKDSFTKQRFTAIFLKLLWPLLLPLRREAIHILYAEYWWRVFRITRREHFDVYHAHDLNTLPIAWLCARLGKAKLVYDSHELWLDRNIKPTHSRLDRFILERLESFLAHRADATIMPGEFCADELRQRYKIAKPHVILNVPYYQDYQKSDIFRNEFQISSDHKILLYMGQVSWWRGIEQEIQSMKFLKNCNLVIFGMGGAGAGGYLDELRLLSVKERVWDRVHFFPPVPFKDVTQCAMSADIGFVLHQNIGLNYYYVCPNKMFECMAAGLPIVGSNFPEVKRFVNGYKVGVTCNPSDPRAIADGVEYILAKPGRLEEMKQNALEAAKTLNWEVESMKLVKLYEGLK